MSRNKKQVRDDTQGKRRESTGTPHDLQNGIVRAAVFSLLKNDDDIMKTIIDAVSQAIHSEETFRHSVFPVFSSKECQGEWSANRGEE